MGAATAEARVHNNSGVNPLSRIMHVVPEAIFRSSESIHPADWREREGVMVAPSLNDADLAGFSINPIIDRNVPGIGNVKLHSIRKEVGRRSTDSTSRIHRLYTVELNGYEHAMEITDPANSKPDYVISSLPGWTEHIEGELRKRLQVNLALQFPSARIASIATNGVGKTGGRYRWRERDQHGLDAMGAQRVLLVRAVSGDLSVIGQGTSMGSVIDHRMGRANFDNDKTRPQIKINLAGQIWSSPAIMSPEQAKERMKTGRFLRNFGSGVTRELVTKTSPLAALDLGMAALLRYGFDVPDILPMTHQVDELRQGTELEEAGQVVEQAPTLVIAGEKDDLFDHEFMDALARRYDGHFRIVLIPGRGHEITMKADKNCRKTSSAAQFLVERALNGLTI